MNYIKRMWDKQGISYVDVSSSRIRRKLWNQCFTRFGFSFERFGRRYSKFRRSRFLTDAYVEEICSNSSIRWAYARWGFFDHEAAWNRSDYLTLTDNHEQELRNFRAQVQIDGDYICALSRDDEFYPHQNENNGRNIDFTYYLPALDRLSREGVYSLRVGAKQKAYPQEIFNKHVIDYSGRFRSEELDVLLVARCKFVLSCTSGYCLMAYLFGKPCAVINYTPLLLELPFSPHDIYIPQMIWDKERKRLLTFREIADYDLCYSPTSMTNIASGWGSLELVKTGPDAIADVALELNNVIDGKYCYSADDNYLQESFRKLFKHYHGPRNTPARVGKVFLEQNEHLFR